MEIITAPSIDSLILPLVDRLAQPLDNPLAEEWLIVPAQGLQLWLTLQIARRLGICSGIRWLRPLEALRGLLGTAGLPAATPGDVFWQLLPQLQHLPEDPVFEPIREFLGGGSRREAELALRLAELFQNYSLYRPAMLEAWRQGRLWPRAEAARWQARLWRALPGPGLPESVLRLPAIFAEGVSDLPPRIHVFGCTHLPPTLLKALAALPPEHPVSLYIPALATDFPMYAANAGLREALRAALRPLPAKRIPLRAAKPAPAAVSLHACAGPLRELEDLRDWLLASFAGDETLRWEDVLIVAPDLRPYQALLPFVMGREPGLPVQLLGQPPLERSALLQAFQRVLEAAGGRMGRQELLELMELEPVARRFGLAPEERELCRHWLDAVKIRWGWDAEQRQELTDVAFAENSWQAGLDRLLLGYVMGHQDRLFAGIAPYADLEGSQGRTLDKLLSLLEALRQLRTQLRKRHALPAWGQLLGDVLARFMQPIELADWEKLTDLFARLAESGESFGQRVGLGRIRSWLRYELRQLEAEPLPGGRISCAPLAMMQGVPARIVCALGLNDRGFPRAEQPSEIDLLSLFPEPGDAGPRSLDRELWLSLLASARQSLRISYQGVSPRDGVELQPSLLLTELQENWPVWDGEKAPVRHPLHPPLPRLTEVALRDFGADALSPAVALSLPLEQLLTFWRNPAGFFLRQRLEYGYPRAADEAADSEAMELQPLDRYQLGQALLGRAGSLEGEYQRLRAQHQLPVGRLGRIRFEEGANQAEAFAARKQAYEAGAEPRPLPVLYRRPGIELSGELMLWPDGLRLSRYGQLRPQELLEAWLSHLLLQLQPLPETQKITRLLGVDQIQRFDPIPLPEPRLAALLELMRQGLSQPLAFFPKSSFAYAEALHKGKAPEIALRDAETAWLGRPGTPGESEKPEWRVCFREQPVLGPVFQDLAERVWLPLLQALQSD